MTDKYILVKVRAADERMTPRSANTNLGEIRKAMHEMAEDHGISMADMVTHTRFMTADETRRVTEIFETAMDRTKRAHARQIKEEWRRYYED